MNRRWLTLLATASLAGCTCHDTPVTRTAYAATASYAPLLGACLINYACPPLCSAVFQLGPEAGIERCDVIAFDPVPAAPGTTPPPSPSPGAPVDLSKLRGVTLRVTYFEHASCDDGADVFIGGDDGTVDDGGGIDDGSNDGSDDGSMDGGSDDGSGSGSTDDGGDDGGDGGDGGGDGGDGIGGGSAIRHVPGPTVHAPAAPHAPAAVVQ